MKDFYVIWILARVFDFHGMLLSRVIQRTYSWRLTRSMVSSTISAFGTNPHPRSRKRSTYTPSPISTIQTLRSRLPITQLFWSIGGSGKNCPQTGKRPKAQHTLIRSVSSLRPAGFRGLNLMRRQAAQLKFPAKRTSLTGEKEMMSLNLLGFAAQSIAV
jgi:hypothetical protein